MHNRTTWLIARVFIGLLASASLAGAQPAADEFNRLNDYLRLGDAVIVTDLTGRNLRGTVQALAPDSIDLVPVTKKPRTISARDVSIIRLEKSDRLLNGVGLGALIGAGLGVVWGAALAGDGNEIVNTAGLLGVIGGATGAGLGAAIDSAIPTKVVVYRKPWTTALAPLVTPGSGAVKVSMRF